MLGATVTFAALLGGKTLLDRRADFIEARAEARYPPVGQLIDIDGHTVHAYVEGSGPDLVLIHGASGNLRDFTFEFTARLTDRFRVIAFDRPGLGWTDRQVGHHAWSVLAESPKMQAQLLARAAQTLGVKNPLVLGHSYGGAVALAWGLVHPQTTAGLMILSGVSNPWDSRLDWTYNVFGKQPGAALLSPFVTAFATKTLQERAVTSVFAPEEVPTGYTQYIGTELTLRRSTLRANARQITSLLPEIRKMCASYPELTMPVEIVHGTQDTIVPFEVHAEPLSRQLADMRLTALEDVAHMPHHSAPDRVVEAIDRLAHRAGLR